MTTIFTRIPEIKTISLLAGKVEDIQVPTLASMSAIPAGIRITNKSATIVYYAENSSVVTKASATLVIEPGTTRTRQLSRGAWIFALLSDNAGTVDVEIAAESLGDSVYIPPVGATSQQSDALAQFGTFMGPGGGGNIPFNTSSPFTVPFNDGVAPTDTPGLGPILYNVSQWKTIRIAGLCGDDIQLTVRFYNSLARDVSIPQGFTYDIGNSVNFNIEVPVQGTWMEIDLAFFQAGIALPNGIIDFLAIYASNRQASHFIHPNMPFNAGLNDGGDGDILRVAETVPAGGNVTSRILGLYSGPCMAFFTAGIASAPASNYRIEIQTQRAQTFGPAVVPIAYLTATDLDARGIASIRPTLIHLPPRIITIQAGNQGPADVTFQISMIALQH